MICRIREWLSGSEPCRASECGVCSAVLPCWRRVALLLTMVFLWVDGYGVRAAPGDTLLLSPQLMAFGFEAAHSLLPGAESGEWLVSDRAAGMVYLLDLQTLHDRQDPLDVRREGKAILRPGDDSATWNGVHGERSSDRRDAGAASVDSEGVAEDYPDSEHNGRVVRPGAMVMLLDHTLALVDEAGSQVLLFEVPSGKKHHVEIPSWARAESGLQPVDLAANELGELFVFDGTTGHIHHFNANTDYLQPVIAEGINEAGALEYAMESLFVSEPGEGRVYVFTEQGWFLARIGRFSQLHRMRVYDQRMWVISGRVLHVFDLSGQHLFNMSLSGVDEPVADVRPQEHDVLLLTPSSLYYVSMPQLSRGQ